MDKLVFIIAQKYYRNYPSYVEYYINNIQTYYPNSLIIVVDNNSTYKDDIFSSIKDKDKVILLDNNIDCKFEIGSYRVAMEYMVSENIIDDYDYFIFTQDNFILKNKFDFNVLRENNVSACSLVSLPNDWAYWGLCESVLNKLGINDHIFETRLCWCSSFILEKNNVIKMLDFFKNITIIDRVGSMASERYLGRILWGLNNNSNFDIDGDVNNLSYYCHTVNAYDDINHFFCKIAQQKTEKTLDI